ncbi:MAG: hypothetical protein HC899_21720 [Leptolyngbyaceae cyanobacterium SM1_4_3]|nr:hypothetical protein [Leptolyngbyaceae cyanobacterium SM1_4_3]NJN90200.1 hypothetical protein [Leptolyngbyaceae cyanobacterium SL_5_14]
MRSRIKLCDRCTRSAPVLYRVQIDESRGWVFICDRCFPTVSQDNPHYTYGGTWKARKRG